MNYLIYKTTNIINGKYYIGMHKTKNKDDGYMGSGKYLLRAIKKYGKDNFITEILLECQTDAHMKLAEKILVVPDIETNYNLCFGGKGGFGYINKLGLNIDISKQKELNPDIIEKSKIKSIEGIRKYNETHKEEIRIRSSIIARNNYLKYGSPFSKLNSDSSFQEKRKSKFKEIEHQKGNKNSQYGTCWVTDGISTLKIKSTELQIMLSKGFIKGRTLKKSKEIK